MLEAGAFLCSSLDCRICRSFYFPPFAAPSDFGCQIPRKPTPFIRRNACSIGSTSQFHDDNVIYGNNFQAERRGEFVLRGALPHLPYGKLAVRSQLLLSLCDFSSKISLPRTGRMRDCSTDWRGKSLTPSSSLRVHGDGKVKRYGWVRVCGRRLHSVWERDHRGRAVEGYGGAFCQQRAFGKTDLLLAPLSTPISLSCSKRHLHSKGSI